MRNQKQGNCFLEKFERLETRNSMLETKLETWASKLDSQLILESIKYQGSSCKSRLSTYIWLVLYVITNISSTLTQL